jgi:hypothetical protein
MRLCNKFVQRINSLLSDSGSIVIETGFMLPVLLFCGFGATELSMAYMNKNSITDMTISYSSILSKKGGAISEKMIKELVDKSNQSSDRPDFLTKGRVILTAIEMPTGAANPVKLWQRCSNQPTGKVFVTKFTGNQVTLPTGAAPLAEDHTYIFVETFYDSQPLTGFFFNQKDSNGKRLKRLSDFRSDMARPGLPFTAAVANPENISDKASSSCG